VIKYTQLILVAAMGLAPLTATPNQAAAATGPGLGRAQTEAASRQVRETCRVIDEGMEVFDEATAEWSVLRARRLTELGAAEDALDICKAQNAGNWEVSCRLQMAEMDAVEDRLRRDMIRSVEGHDARFQPLARQIEERINELVSNPYTYQYLLAQADRDGTESDLLKFLLITLDQVDRLRTTSSRTVLTAYLGELLDAVEAMEEDIRLLEELSPQIEHVIAQYDREPVIADTVARHAYPTP